MSGHVAYFASKHPLANVAAVHCRKHLAVRIGGVACGECWELAIRDDERLVVEADLPREITPDPDYVDHIAVDLACRGERVRLTPADLRAAVARLHGQGVRPARIASRLRANYTTVAALLDGAPADGRAA